ncbi:DNA polymerase [Sporolactobacillus shoreicorticis]|uniref:DNA-directed DNA polymerase n=1 Tax=Sporolactobacillus shoreicorticis TaxID=1923877 RepID=A0ABW5RZX9_9BACL|nr:DNA polymerase [Sporolactobacillus shoreicorticis]MCO7125092.1 DNA polymerase [Sporolactobacillus shoreicorticis]
MTTLGIDIETFSDNSIDNGVYKYVDSPKFRILLFAFAFDNDPVQVLDLEQGEELPKDVKDALQLSGVVKTAFNANFERTCLSKTFGYANPEDWRCSMVLALSLGLPASLDGVAKVLKLDVQKDSAGKNLIKFFSIPCEPDLLNEGRTRHLPQDDPDGWERFKFYNGRDVDVERDIRGRLLKYAPSDFENHLWAIDQRINDRGVAIDPQLVENAIRIDEANSSYYLERAQKLTGLPNPNSPAQIKKWLEDQGMDKVGSLGKKLMPGLIKRAPNETVREVLRIRQATSRTSTAKYTKMADAVCQDGRVHGSLQFYGASHTGRWAGRIIQPQNLAKNHMTDLDLDTARQLLWSGDEEGIKMLFDDTADTLSQLVRTALVPAKGHKFVVSDFSAIEARVIAWLAGEKWRLDVFRSHGKIYEASASQMFHVPIESIKKGDPLRQKGKVAELALGYGGGSGALIQMGALDMGLSRDELPDIVEKWRNASPAIVMLWRDCNNAALTAVKKKTTVSLQKGLKFIYESGMLFIQLPSGRRIAFAKPRIEPDPTYGRDQLTYEGTGKSKQQLPGMPTNWVRLRTYGGKLVENIVQATARDCLAHAMTHVDEAGIPIVFHVHDELVAEVPEDGITPNDMSAIMCRKAAWMKGLPLKADGYETHYYKKD